MPRLCDPVSNELIEYLKFADTEQLNRAANIRSWSEQSEWNTLVELHGHTQPLGTGRSTHMMHITNHRSGRFRGVFVILMALPDLN